jgi:NADH-quinone oxidoreductase subunit A
LNKRCPQREKATLKKSKAASDKTAGAAYIKAFDILDSSFFSNKIELERLVNFMRTLIKLPLKLLVLPLILLTSTVTFLFNKAIEWCGWLLNLFMAFLLGCGIYTALHQQWSQTLLLFLLAAVCVALIFGAAFVLGALQFCTEKLLLILRA